VVHCDAGRWLRERAAPQSVRLLHVDLYDQDAAAPVLDDEAFYADCRRVLDDGGVASINLFGRDASFARSLAHIVAAFGAAHVCSLRATREGNTVVVATRDTPLPPREQLLARARALELRFKALGLAARQWPRLLRPVPAHAVAAETSAENGA
jgi:spermidine synthase